MTPAEGIQLLAAKNAALEDENKELKRAAKEQAAKNREAVKALRRCIDSLR